MLHQLQGNRELAEQHYRRHPELSFQDVMPDGPEPEELAEAEALLMYLVNAERLAIGLPALRPHWRLSVAARRHSNEMRSLNYFSHVSPVRGRQNAQRRYELDFGTRPPLIAENLARRRASFYCFDLGRIVDSHQGLMDSPGHKRAILLDRVERIGVGISVADDGDYFIAELFARM